MAQGTSKANVSRNNVGSTSRTGTGPLGSAGEKVAEGVEAAVEHVTDAASAVSETVSTTTDSLSKAIRQRPVSSLAVAAGVGFGLALLLTSAQGTPGRNMPKNGRLRRRDFRRTDRRKASNTLGTAETRPVQRDHGSSLSDKLIDALNDNRAMETLTDAANQAMKLWDSLKR